MLAAQIALFDFGLGTIAGTEPPIASVVRPDWDAELMLQCAAGSMESFCEIVERQQKNLLTYFARLGVGNECYDLTQETFVRLYNFRHRYQPQAKFTTFLYRIAHHVWVDSHRKKSRYIRFAQCYEQEAAHHHTAAKVPNGNRIDITTALDQLTPKLREIIVLNIYQSLSYDEIAKALGIPLGTVKSRLHFALQELRKILT